MNERTERANELLRRYVIAKYREEYDSGHLSQCPDLAVEEFDAWDGLHGCDTGCEVVKFEATMVCPHGERFEFEYGEFDNLSSLLFDMEREADRDDAC